MQIRSENDTVYLSGDITVQTLNRNLAARFASTVSLPEITKMDFSGVGRADSAALSLIFDMLRQKKHENIGLIALPVQIRELSELYEVQQWLTL